MAGSDWILSEIIPSDDSAGMIVMSPLATMRWRRGRLQLSSPSHPKTLVVESELALLLLDLVEPRSVSWFISRQSNISCADRRNILAVLIDLGIIEITGSSAGVLNKGWWDPNDKARDEIVILQLIQIAHGFARSAGENASVDHWGRPMPRIARPVIDFLFQLDLSQLSIFEFGGGASTFYWARHCASCVTAESDKAWADRLLDSVGSRARVLYRPERKAFTNSILETDDRYDIILVDAIPAFRSECVKPAIERLSTRGMVILDDAPFYPDAAAALRNFGLIEVDVTGFSTLEDNLQTTSLFLSRMFDLPRSGPHSPLFPFGSPGFDWTDLETDQ